MTDILNMKKGYSQLQDLVDGVLAISLLASDEGYVYFLNPSHTNASDTGPVGEKRNNKDRPFATLAAAEDALVANQNDILVYVGANTSITLSAALTWDKDYTHFIGVAAPTGVANRARIFQLSTLTDASPLLNITASGCIFSNIYIFQGVDDTGSLVNVQVTGGRNYFDTVHFAGGGHATQAINGGASLKLNGAEECRFVNCTFGVDTVSAATGMAGVLWDAEAHRIKFEDCYFTLYAGNANVFHHEVIDNTGFDRYNTFRGCLFTNTASQAMDTVFEIPAGVGAPRTFYLYDGTVQHGADDWEDNDRGVVFLDAGTITAGGNAGIMQATNST